MCLPSVWRWRVSQELRAGRQSQRRWRKNFKVTTQHTFIPKCTCEDSDDDNVEVRLGTAQKFDLIKARGMSEPNWGSWTLKPPAGHGTRYTFPQRLGGKLERADQLHAEPMWTTRLPGSYPMVNRGIVGTGQLPKFEEDAWNSKQRYFLIPTAEVPVTNIYKDDILDETSTINAPP